MTSTHASGVFVTVGLWPSCLAHFRLDEVHRIAELWMTPCWETWRQWLAPYPMR